MTTTPTPRPSTPLLNQKTGLMEKEWFRFISLFFSSSEETAAVVVNNTAQINALTALTNALTALVNTLNLEVAVLEKTTLMPPLQPLSTESLGKEFVPQSTPPTHPQDLFGQTPLGVAIDVDPFTQLHPLNTPVHVSTRPTEPSIVAGVGAGTAPTVGVIGNDTAMQVTITTGTAPAGTASEVATITYGAPFPTTPHPVFSPANDNSSALTELEAVFIDGTSSTEFVLTSGASALADSTTYIWNVHTIG